MSSMNMKLYEVIPARSLFHFAIPCYYQHPLWSEDGVQLTERHRIPSLAGIDGKVHPIEVRAGWSEEGFAVRFQVFDQRTAIALANDSRVPPIRVWIDTRAVHDVHRATRFCHFFELATSQAKNTVGTVVVWRAIPRAKESPQPPPKKSIQVNSRVYSDGYCVEAFFQRDALTGYDPREYPRLGFNYLVWGVGQREYAFSADTPLPFGEDPSFWATLDLVS